MGRARASSLCSQSPGSEHKLELLQNRVTSEDCRSVIAGHIFAHVKKSLCAATRQLRRRCQQQNSYTVLIRVIEVPNIGANSKTFINDQIGSAQYKQRAIAKRSVTTGLLPCDHDSCNCTIVTETAAAVAPKHWIKTLHPGQTAPSAATGQGGRQKPQPEPQPTAPCGSPRSSHAPQQNCKRCIRTDDTRSVDNSGPAFELTIVATQTAEAAPCR